MGAGQKSWDAGLSGTKRVSLAARAAEFGLSCSHPAPPSYLWLLPRLAPVAPSFAGAAATRPSWPARAQRDPCRPARGRSRRCASTPSSERRPRAAERAEPVAQPVVPPHLGRPDADPRRSDEAAPHRQPVAQLRVEPGAVGDAAVRHPRHRLAAPQPPRPRLPPHRPRTAPRAPSALGERHGDRGRCSVVGVARATFLGMSFTRLTARGASDRR